MKRTHCLRNLLLFSFAVFCLQTAHAQSFGLSIGYTCSSNRLKIRDPRWPAVAERYKDVKMQTFALPNFFVRPYFRIHNRFAVFTGLDLMKYQLECTENISHTKEAWWVQQHFNVFELHLPVGLRYTLNDETSDHIHTVYAGVFARFPLAIRQEIVFAPSFIGRGKVPAHTADQQSQLWHYTNIVAGYEYRYMPWTNFAFSANAFVKYMPATLSPSQYDRVVMGFPYYRSGLSFHLSVGCHFIKAPKNISGNAAQQFRLPD